jgi:hypothetical protein
MPSAEVLKRVFNEAVKRIKPLVRIESNPELLAKEGFNTTRQSRPYGESHDYTWGETTGIHYAKNPYEATNLKYGEDVGVVHPTNVEAIPLPSARVKNFSIDEWRDKYLINTISENNALLKNKYDFITYPDLTADQSHLLQTVQLNPNKAIAKIKLNNKDIYRILGIAGALGITDQLNPDEAKSMPIGNLIKAGTSAAKLAARGSKSSAAVDLIGKSLEGEALKGLQLESKTIKNITKGVGDWRNIIFDDGSSLPVTKDYINDLMRATGTVKYITKFNKQGTEGKLQQALNALKDRRNRTLSPMISKSYIKGKMSQHLNKTSELLTPNTQKMVGVYEGKTYLTLPEEYAKILEEEGLIRIDRSKTGEIK